MQGLQGLQANNSTMFSFPYSSQFNGGRSSSVTGSPVGSPSPPLTLYGHPYADTARYGSASSPTSTSSLPLCLKTNYHNHQRMPTVTASNFRKSTTGKSSFTIEAILGLQSRHSDDDDDENTMDHHNGTINSSSSNHHHHNYLHGVGTTGMVHSTVPHESHVYYNTKSEGGVSGMVSSHLSQATSGRNVATGNYFNGVQGSQNQQQNQSRFHHQHHHQNHSQGGGNSSHHHLSHHHYVPVVDPYICTSQQLSPPCLSPDSTRKDKPSPLRRSYQSQHSPNSGADSDQSSSTTGSQHRLTPKMTPNGSIGGQHSPISSAKSKRVRTIFTPEQLERLEREFERQQYMVGPERLYLASALQLSEAQVKVWFQNRRIKWRKQHLEMQQARLAKFRGGSDSEESQITTEEVIPDV